MGEGGQTSKERIHLVVPEMLDVFKSHNMALSSVLLYSPQSLARIQRLIAGREAYIISATVSREDLAVADRLGEWWGWWGCSLTELDLYR